MVVMLVVPPWGKLHGPAVVKLYGPAVIALRCCDETNGERQGSSTHVVIDNGHISLLFINLNVAFTHRFYLTRTFVLLI